MVSLWMLLLLICGILPWLLADAVTDPGEVISLQSIADKLDIKGWNFNADPCGWSNTVSAPYILCECNNSTNDSTCHVTTLYLYGLSLIGEIPLEITNLTHLHVLNMELNVLNGSIPGQLGSLTALTELGFGLNDLSGTLPLELGNLTKLTRLTFNSNRLSGTFPKEYGKLRSLTWLAIDGNELSGSLPLEIGQLTNLTMVSMFGNSFSGQIPDVFEDMLQLSTLRLYGTNISGPVPSSILSLASLTILHLGDMSSGGILPSSFKGLKNVTYLSLRHNGLSGSIPDDLGTLVNLYFLDLSFNNLTGRIPTSFAALANLTLLFIGNNSLQGNISVLGDLRALTNLDVSNNQLSGSLPAWVNRSSLEVNLLWNFFDQHDNNSRLVSASFNCLDADSPCTRTSQGQNAQFSINCGGPEVSASSSSTTFSADSEQLGNSSYYESDGKTWGVSYTGYEGLDGSFPTILTTTFTVQRAKDQDLYKTARGAADSLKYYGLSMINGPYIVELHFAEIVIPADDTWESKGRRIFDVYIQGAKVLENFDIKSAANGSLIAVVKNFSANVTENTLEVHFLWAGKGTCCSPSYWTYGPLVSAINVYANFSLPAQASSSKKQNVFVIVAPVVAGVLVSLVIIFVVLRRKYFQANNITSKSGGSGNIAAADFSNMEGKPYIFKYNELKIATQDFHAQNKLGEGGFGSVFKGCLPDGTMVAVKMLSSDGDKGNDEFMNEVAIISAVQHRNLVRLLGCCVEESRRILVLELVENNSLLHTFLGRKVFLDWSTRFNICLGIARGLTYLHEASRIRIVHRDIKASNILLDKDLNPKIADFGLAKLFPENKTHISTRVAGTLGYLAPEYAFRGNLTEKADVYSFGILLLEIVSGRSNTDAALPNTMVYLLEWTWQLYEENKILDLADETLEGNFSKEELEKVIHVALLCTQAAPVLRPKMSEALSLLNGTERILLKLCRPSFLSDLKQLSMETNMENSTLPSSSLDSSIPPASYSSESLLKMK